MLEPPAFVVTGNLPYRKIAIYLEKRLPETKVVFYSGEGGSAPVYETLRAMLAAGQRKAVAKCQVRIQRLHENGHQLRRPESDYLRDGIHELRARHGRVNYRILYFFRGGTAVLSHLITKEGSLPEEEIDRAIMHKQKFAIDPKKRTLQV